MASPPKSVALIVAAGKGERAGSALPKQYARIAGQSLLARSVDGFARHPAIGAFYVVIGAGQEAQAEAALDGRAVTAMLTGGAERQDSVRAGLCAIQAAGGVDHVLIHDAARPFLPTRVIDRLLMALDTATGAVPVLPVVDSLARASDHLGESVDRAALYRVQTPQAFRFDAIMTSHQRWTGAAATDDAQVARAAGYEVALVEGDPMLDKITHPSDFAAAEARIAANAVPHTAIGFDVHRLEAGRELWLGGVLIPHDKGLAGHSDADAALHALTDALLGTVAEGDIGSHFPPSDAQWRGAASHQFLEHARDLIASKGGRIVHVDLTIMCEAPKIGPHRTAMRERIATLLRLDPGAVSVKATTTEGLGFTGRGEGIAAQAVATITLPG
jgi:2-C-methyl-D-erythritol 4-phosphate cytidylyltransferase / 2-C-methyl-D-erythritol 2,4-cyclodiphosphate synthase